MKNTYALSVILFFLSTIWELNYGQNIDFPLSLVSENIEYLRTETYPRRPVNKFNGITAPVVVYGKRDIYRITITVQVKCTNCIYSEPFVIQITDSRNNKTLLRFNNKRHPMYAEEFYTFKADASFKWKGFAKLILGQVDPSSGIFYYDKFSPSITESTIYICMQK